MENQDKKNQPVAKSKVGRFQVSVWKKKKLFQARNDFDVEREVEMVRVCIQYSTFNKGQNTWTNQSIWCNPDELRDLANALDKLNDKLNEGNRGDIVASGSKAQPVTCSITTIG